jgi:hypothetical protein
MSLKLQLYSMSANALNQLCAIMLGAIDRERHAKTPYTMLTTIVRIIVMGLFQKDTCTNPNIIA